MLELFDLNCDFWISFEDTMHSDTITTQRCLALKITENKDISNELKHDKIHICLDKKSARQLYYYLQSFFENEK